MLQNFNIKVIGRGYIPVQASSYNEAKEILQAYIDKHSLNWIIYG